MRALGLRPVLLTDDNERAARAVAAEVGTDAAIEADLTLVRGDLRAAVDAIRLARRTLRTIKGNLCWAFAYTVAALPIAAAGRLNPMLAGAPMALSSVFVVTNSLRLRRFQPAAGATHLAVDLVSVGRAPRRVARGGGADTD